MRIEVEIGHFLVGFPQMETCVVGGFGVQKFDIANEKFLRWLLGGTHEDRS